MTSQDVALINLCNTTTNAIFGAAFGFVTIFTFNWGYNLCRGKHSFTLELWEIQKYMEKRITLLAAGTSVLIGTFF